jgi:hypothetical protein
LTIIKNYSKFTRKGKRKLMTNNTMMMQMMMMQRSGMGGHCFAERMR